MGLGVNVGGTEVIMVACGGGKAGDGVSDGERVQADIHMLVSTEMTKRFILRVNYIYGNSGNKIGKKIMVVINKITVNNAPTRA